MTTGLTQYRHSQSFGKHSGVQVSIHGMLSLPLGWEHFEVCPLICYWESCRAASVLVAGMWGVVGSGALPPGWFCPDE